MKRSYLRNTRVIFAMVTIACAYSVAWTQATITIDASYPGAKVSPRMYGIFFEEISRSGDGGLYAEMLQNRSFEDFNQPVGWEFVKHDAQGEISLDQTMPLNDRNPTSLRLKAISIKSGGRVGVSNQGFKGALVPDAHDPVFQLDKAQQDATNPVYAKWLKAVETAQHEPGNGLAVQKGETYLLSAYLRAEPGFSGSLMATIETQGGTILASQAIDGLGSAWKPYMVQLTPKKSDENVRFVLSIHSQGTVWMDLVSLMPTDTFMHRTNGLRADMMKMLAALHPAFVRFPGGSYAEGYTLRGAYHWKETVGDVAQRPGHWNIWGYRSSDGLGFEELLQMSEDLKAESLYVPNCGIAEKEMVPVDKEEPWIQDALDAIAYANAPSTDPWGAMRARAGHPAPFGLKLIEIGNENGMSYSWGGGNAHQYAERYKPFYDRLKAAYPDTLTIASAPIQKAPERVPVEVVDEHYYHTPEWFEQHADQYDSYDRSGPKVYVGEYASKSEAGHGNLKGALGEAAFMTGMERNSDVVIMSSYAPLFVNPHTSSWWPDLLVFDSARVYGTPSYYNQLLFANNRPDEIVPLEVHSPAVGQPEPTGKTALRALYAVAGKLEASGELILKVVNIGASAQETQLKIVGLGTHRLAVSGTVLRSASPMDENSFDQPGKVAPRNFDAGRVAGSFPYSFPPYSVTLMRLRPTEE